MHRQLSHREGSRGSRWVAGKCFYWEGKQGFRVLRERYGSSGETNLHCLKQSLSPGLLCTAGRSMLRALGSSGPSSEVEEVREGKKSHKGS